MPFPDGGPASDGPASDGPAPDGPAPDGLGLDGPAPSRRSRRGVAVGLALGAVVVVAATVALVATADRREPLGEPATAATPAPATTTPPTPFDAAGDVLTAHAAALLAGDEEGWLAAVDPKQPKLVARYRALYRHLRELGVSHFAYHPFQVVPPAGAAAGTVGMGTDVAYCFSLQTCPQFQRDPWRGPPRIRQTLTFRPVAGRYVITKLSRADEPNDLQPTPWENAGLVFAQGRRVTVAASRSQAGNLARVLKVAEQAAAANDRFAAYLGTPQQRYRVYLADRKAWRSWYGGERNKWIIGYAIPLNDAQTDVVLNAAELMSDRRLLSETIRHEMGHVITVGGVTMRDHEEERWLSEGIAEYIGAAPRTASSSWRRAGVRATVRGSRRPTTIAVPAPGPDAGARATDAFYGLGHFAVDCLAQTYGERQMFDFVRLVLRADNTYDQASRDAFGKPFAAVDKACVRWIRKRA